MMQDYGVYNSNNQGVLIMSCAGFFMTTVTLCIGIYIFEMCV